MTENEFITEQLLCIADLWERIGMENEFLTSMGLDKEGHVNLLVWVKTAPESGEWTLAHFGSRDYILGYLRGRAEGEGI